MAKTPSPCIDVCKFRRAGHCIGCSMTKAQKKAFKELSSPSARAACVGLVRTQQVAMGGYDGWRAAYARKCAKKGVAVPPEERGGG